MRIFGRRRLGDLKLLVGRDLCSLQHQDESGALTNLLDPGKVVSRSGDVAEFIGKS